MKIHSLKKAVAIPAFLMLCIVTIQAQQDWRWANKGGGWGTEGCKDICTDPQGNSYIAAYFYDTIAVGTYTFAPVGGRDVVIAKYNRFGSLLSAYTYGGWQDEYVNCIAADTYGNVYFCGTFSDTIVIGTDTMPCLGNTDVYTAKIDPSGNVLWTSHGGGNNLDFINSVACDNAGNCWITGYIKGDCYFDSVLVIPYGSNNQDFFVTKYDAAGSVVFAFASVGAGQEFGYDLITDEGGNFYMTGSYTGSLTIGTNTLTNSGFSSSDVFVAKYNASGNPVWATGAGGNNNDVGYSISRDGAGNLYVAGTFSTTAYFGQDTLVSAGGLDIFISKLNTTGNFTWSKGIGNSSTNVARGIAADKAGSFYIAGSLSGTLVFDTITLTSAAGNTEPFVVKYNTAGNALWGKQASGTSTSAQPYSIALDSYGDAFIAGVFNGTNNFGPFSITRTGLDDFFIASIGCNITLNSSVTSADALCFGDNTGSAMTNATGGTAPYNYLWWNSTPAQNSSSATNLSAGTYMVFVSDANGCTVTDTAVVNNPAQLMVSSTFGDATCSSCCDGSAALVPAGGTGGYTYSWLPAGNTTAAVNNLCPGTYTACVTDANGCSVCDMVTITFTTGTETIYFTATDVKIYPDPINEASVLSVPAELTGVNARCEVYDLAGKLITGFPITGEKTTVGNLNLQAGLYIYTVISKNKKVFTSKMSVR